MTDLLVIRIVFCASLPKVFDLATLHIWSLIRHCPTAGFAHPCLWHFRILQSPLSAAGSEFCPLTSFRD